MDTQDLGLHGLIGGGGSNIKSVQRGQLTLSTTQIDITISAVDLTKAIPIISSYSNQVTAATTLLRAKLINPTTLRIYLNTYGNATNVTWDVVEFNNVKSLQIGDTVDTVATTVSAVNVNKSMLFASSTATSTAGYYRVSYFLLDSTTINIKSMPITLTTTWYLVEFN
jgi:hypothetical protein